MRSCSPVDSIRTPSQSSSNLDYETFRAIQSLKARYVYTFEVALAERNFVFRALTWAEHRELVERSNEDPEQADLIVKAALLYPAYEEVVEEVDAGVIEALATEIVGSSGFASVEAFNEGLEWAREEVNKVEFEVIGAICKAFPGYKPEDIYQMRFPDLMIRLAMAEKILGLAPEGGQDVMPVTPGMQAYGGPPPGMMAADELLSLHASNQRSEKEMRGKAAPPDFEKDNAELTRPR